MAEEIAAKIERQAEKIRNLKKDKADASVVQAEVAALLVMKTEYKTLTGNDYAPSKPVEATSVEKQKGTNAPPSAENAAKKAAKKDEKAKKKAAYKTGADEEDDSTPSSAHVQTLSTIPLHTNIHAPAMPDAVVDGDVAIPSLDSRLEKILLLIGLSQNGTAKKGVAEQNSLLLEIIQAQKPELLGPGGVAAELNQWLSFSISLLTQPENELQKSLSAFNETLVLRSFLVGPAATIADVAVFEALSQKVSLLIAFGEVARWFEHIRFLFAAPTCFSHATLPSWNTATVLPVRGVVAASGTSVSAPGSEKKVEDKKSLDAAPSTIVADSTSASTAVAAEPSGDSKAAKKSAKKDSVDKPKSEAVPIAGPESTGKEEGSDVSPNLLDMRVGLVVKCWNHPDSEKLLCEEVDVGEASPRLIASGIRAFYSAEQVLGRKVVVLTNLKERSLAGFKSQGMVLAASTEDHGTVRLLEAPDVPPGTRVLVPNVDVVDPATPAQMAKKKIWEKASVLLRTNAEGVVCWHGFPVVADTLNCRAELPDAAVS